MRERFFKLYPSDGTKIGKKQRVKKPSQAQTRQRKSQDFDRTKIEKQKLKKVTDGSNLVEKGV